MKAIHSILVSLLIVMILSSCVSSKLYNDLKSQQEKLDKDHTKLKKDLHNMEIRNLELVEQIEQSENQVKGLTNETAELQLALNKKQELYENLSETYEQLLSNKDKLASQHATETQKLLLKLQTTEKELEQREKKLNELESAVNAKESSVKRLNDELFLSQKDMQQREIRMKELEDMLSKKDSSVNALKNILSQALLGFKDKGLSVQIKNGMVYVSLEEQLLFKSGSATIDVKGEEALMALANVLGDHPEMSILIEGHTDNVPYKGTGAVKDNWDLSAMRATAVVRILTKNKDINPKRLTSAGRSEYIPIDEANTVDARKKNRRIEIILTPKLDELYQLLDSH